MIFLHLAIVIELQKEDALIGFPILGLTFVIWLSMIAAFRLIISTCLGLDNESVVILFFFQANLDYCYLVFFEKKVIYFLFNDGGELLMWKEKEKAKKEARALSIYLKEEQRHRHANIHMLNDHGIFNTQWIYKKGFFLTIFPLLFFPYNSILFKNVQEK